MMLTVCCQEVLNLEGTLSRVGMGLMDGVCGRRCGTADRGWLGGMNWAGPGRERRGEEGNDVWKEKDIRKYTQNIYIYIY